MLSLLEFALLSSLGARHLLVVKLYMISTFISHLETHDISTLSRESTKTSIFLRSESHVPPP